ncbi:MAG: flagellar basal body-associated FliL family protein [Rubrobacteridae bacterium]|nr:flagellar basal body-associated FliL family protein [Rubrobacteridae bacterium]
MAEEQATNEVESAPPKEEAPKDKKPGLFGKLKLPILIVVVASLAVGSGLFVTKVAKGNSEKDKKEAVKEEKNKEVGKFITLDPFTVNLSGGTNYLQTAVAFEVKSDNAELAKELEERKPQINDSVITILSAKTVEEIDTAQKREKLKNEIKKSVDSMLSYGKIERVYFSTFIMQ